MFLKHVYLVFGVRRSYHCAPVPSAGFDVSLVPEIGITYC